MRLWTQLGALAVLSGIVGAAAAQDDITWLDYREALRVAKETRKPLFVEFRCEA